MATIDMPEAFCPSCGNETLKLRDGKITCFHALCRNPIAARLILREKETEHIVEIEEERFHVKHPLAERIGDALLTCSIHQQISGYPSGMLEPGRYRVTQAGIALDFEAVD